MSCPVGTDVSLAARLIREGGLVAFPTETVYGLGADALNPQAVARVFEVKQRPTFDPLIVHIADCARLEQLVVEVPETARRLIERFWPGPLTIVLPKREVVPDLVTAGLPTVAVRMPDHRLALELIRLADRPIAAPSANRFGRLSPTTAQHVMEQLGEKIDYILDGGACRVGVESTVVECSDEGLVILRPGGISLEELQTIVQPVRMADDAERGETKAKRSPGRLPQHYAPHKPLVVVDDPRSVADAGRCGLLVLRAVPEAERFGAVEILSQSGDLREAAARFFAALRRLDAAPIERIVAVAFPERGLGRALNDRLRRAASRR